MRSFLLLSLILAYTAGQSRPPADSLADPLARGGQAGQPAGPVSVSPCRAGYVRPDFRALRAEYRTHIARWKPAGRRDYTFDYHQFAAPVVFPDVNVTVTGGVPRATLKPGQSGEPLPQARQSVGRHFLTVWATLSDWERQPCPDVQVSYDPTYGFPNRVYVGSALANIADGNGEWTLSNFRPR